MSGYNYMFGEADEITRRIEGNRRRHDRNDDTPPLVSPEHWSDNIYPTMNHYQPQGQATMSVTFNSIPGEHHQFQHQPTIRRQFCWRCFMSLIISWLMSFFVPTNRPRPIRRPLPSNTPPPSTSGLSSSAERSRDRPSQHSRDEMFILPTSQEIIQRSVVPERISSGIGLTERQISQLPTIKFQPSIEDKKFAAFAKGKWFYQASFDQQKNQQI
ncbi:hypothetical protein HID58_004098 [Brassica napus]|uniref:Uncharacterized protein n=1 Tax=Brassica napus TaxID=3708 RepID=A0ABQ8ASK8_BRANA|nr:hypothetical protein HID58_045065 [Brassica napus]KAH0936637.1 hypothetical protein HID58_004098 [Brassica napus]